MRGLFVGEHPNVGGNAGVVEKVERQGNNGFQPVIFDEPAADVAFALSGIAGEKRTAVVNLRNATTQRRFVVHFGRHVGKEKHLSIAGTGYKRHFFALVHHFKARIAHTVLAAHGFKVFLPALAVRRVGEHEVELLRRESIVRKRRPFRAADDVIGVFAFALQQHVGFANGVGLGIDFLPVQMTANLEPAPFPDSRERFFRHGEHTARTAGTVVEQIGTGLQTIFNRQKHEVCHQAHGITRRPVLTGLFVVFLVELANQLLKNCSHGMVVNARRREVYSGVEKFIDQCAQRIGFGERRNLVAKFEVFDDVLNVLGKAVEIILKVGQKRLLATARLQIAQSEL